MLPLVNDAFLTLKPYPPGKPISETERELGITGCIKLASNENPLGPSPKAVAAVSDILKSLHDYPDGGGYYLKDRLAEFVGYGTDHIILGNGTNELIEMLIRTCIRPGENMVYAEQSFIAYKLCGLAANAEIIEVPLKDMRYDLEAMAAAMNDKTKLVFIANPNNPTGTYVSKAEMDAFMKAVPEQVIVVLDEAYLEYVDAPDYPSALDYLEVRDRVMVTRTFSKCYGLAGLRVGYGVAKPELIDFLNRGRQPFNCNSLAQAGALAALDDQAHVDASVELNNSERTRLSAALSERGLGVVPSQANFILVDFKRDGAQVYQDMLQKGVIIRPMGGYGLTTFGRISIGTKPQNDRMLSVLDEVLEA